MKKLSKAKKQKLVDTVIESLKNDIQYGDYTILEELLKFIPNKNLVMSLDENEWKKYPEVNLTEPKFICTNCNNSFKRNKMVFDKDNENDFCKD